MAAHEVPVHGGARAKGEDAGGYVVPLVHLRLPERAVQYAFWGALGSALVVGAVDLPVAAAVAGGVVIARHVHG